MLKFVVFAKKVDLSKVDKLDINELKNVLTDLSKLFYILIN